eukprot:TRINITY_DN6041_c0_g1_i2.p1 TRINITY_DN6041_c0_g1~~TRINITY_DN6041_c0_g1_i2.p1  ORF type:complete len:303 (+),score=48.57 TRINITY_DN6041_c0_g1_i2:401-1309(+)
MLLYTLSTSAVFHVRRMILDYGGWSTTVSQLFMIQVLHLSYVAWDYSDGADKESKSRTKLVALPSLLEFTAAALSPTQVLAGPFSHLTDFLNYIYRRHEYAHDMPFTWVGFIRLGTSLVWIVVYAVIGKMFPFRLIYTEKFQQGSFFEKLFYIEVIGTGTKAKYYGTFKLLEAIVIFSGQAYNGIDARTKSPKFDKMRMTDIPSTEFSVFLKNITDEWNRPTRLWLKDCIHVRIHANVVAKVFITFVASALWHGFYPVYLMAFSLYAVAVVNTKFTYKMCMLHKAWRNPIFYIAQAYSSIIA